MLLSEGLAGERFRSGRLEQSVDHRRVLARRTVAGRDVAVSMKEWAELGDALIHILDGEVDENDLLRGKTLLDIYTRNQKKIDLAFKVRAKKDMLFEVEKLRAALRRQ